MNFTDTSYDKNHKRNFRNTDLFFESLKEPHGMIFCDDEMVGIDCNPQAMKEAHFATFPEKLIEPCILAGTSKKGCCVECGCPWERVVEKSGGTTGKSWHNHEKDSVRGQRLDNEEQHRKMEDGTYNVKTTGWQPTCKCTGETTPCTVLDIFGGAMTTAIVAHKHGRKFVMIELSKPYIDEIGIPRIKKATEQLKLF